MPVMSWVKRHTTPNNWNYDADQICGLIIYHNTENADYFCGYGHGTFDK